MVTQLQPDVRAYLHGGEVIKRYIRVEEVAHEYGFSVEETEYIAKQWDNILKGTKFAFQGRMQATSIPFADNKWGGDLTY